MAKKSTDTLLLVGAGVALAVALFAKSSQAQTTMNTGNVQTATVGPRVYSITKLGQGNYLVALVSTNGVLQISPVNYTFSQTGPLGQIGDPAAITQLKQDMPSFNVNFNT